ncbi:MAG: hypothetical protein IKU48_02105 [Clostridia bacterium]|nr:hypothetical protein [Clostridia bacterium]
MKKSKIFILVAATLLIVLSVVAVASATISDKTLDIIDAIITDKNMMLSTT